LPFALPRSRLTSDAAPSATPATVEVTASTALPITDLRAGFAAFAGDCFDRAALARVLVAGFAAAVLRLLGAALFFGASAMEASLPRAAVAALGFDLGVAFLAIFKLLTSFAQPPKRVSTIFRSGRLGATAPDRRCWCLGSRREFG